MSENEIDGILLGISVVAIILAIACVIYAVYYYGPMGGPW